MLEQYLAMLELGYYEAKFALEGLADKNVWQRPAAGLLSVGELAGHIALWEAVKFAGEVGDQMDPVLAKCRLSSPLIDRRFLYYPTTLANEPIDQPLLTTAEQVYAELVRVHEAAIAILRALNPDLESRVPNAPPHYTYGEFLRYAVFHVSYHVGQMYSVRHLLGEQTPDN
jgi:hypothetical protein